MVIILFTLHYSLFTASAQDKRMTAEEVLAEMTHFRTYCQSGEGAARGRQHTVYGNE